LDEALVCDNGAPMPFSRHGTFRITVDTLPIQLPSALLTKRRCDGILSLMDRYGLAQACPRNHTACMGRFFRTTLPYDVRAIVPDACASSLDFRCPTQPPNWWSLQHCHLTVAALRSIIPEHAGPSPRRIKTRLTGTRWRRASAVFSKGTHNPLLFQKCPPGKRWS
jgi:hypothetical protein